MKENIGSHLLLICGPSGVGKSTLIDLVEARTKKAKQAYSVTTRELRANTNDKRISVSMDQFVEMQAAGLLIESIIYDGNAYGIPISSVEKILQNNMVALLDCNESGVIQVLKSKIAERITTVFLVCSPEQLVERQFRRNIGTLESQKLRLSLALSEIEGANNREIFQYVICNDDLETAAEKVMNLINGIPIVSDSFDVEVFKAELQLLIDNL